MSAGCLFADHALLPTGWAHKVLLHWDAQGFITQVVADAVCPPGVARAAGPMLPGMPNLHSHAFQRVMAGLTEYRGTSQDSFWSWRELMYRFANHITPEQLEAIATALYTEMLEAGYTSVCEFHYLHHDLQGQAYADDSTLAQCLLKAAQTTGIGLSLLPVLYQTRGFGSLPPLAEQRRFLRNTDNYLRLLQQLAPLCQAQGVRLGAAPHSLRAVPPDSLQQMLVGLQALDSTAPIHIHIAEQTAEVEACWTWSGQRPVEWLLNHTAVDSRWCLVHATHLTPTETQAAARTGAVAGLCPSTEANLGDGIFDYTGWAAAGGAWGIGSDSHSCVNAAEELMQLEYSQRLLLRQRNVVTHAGQAQVATALSLAAVAGGAQASARPITGLAVGQRADWVVLDRQHALLQGLDDPAQMLSVHVFASHRRSAIQSVWVAGVERVKDGQHTTHAQAYQGLIKARQQLLA